MSLADEIATLKSTLTTSAAAVKGAFNRKTQEAFTADNALALEGSNAAAIVAAGSARADQHAALRNNPHGTLAADLNMYTSAQIDALVAGIVPNGVIPLTQVGDPNTDVSWTGTVNAATRVVTLPAMPLFMAGGSYNTPPSGFTVPDNTTQHFYIKLLAGVPTWVMQSSTTPETTTTCYVGTVQFSGGALAKNTLGKVTRIDTYRISKTPAGSAIPVSTGDPSVAGALAWR